MVNAWLFQFWCTHIKILSKLCNTLRGRTPVTFRSSDYLLSVFCKMRKQVKCRARLVPWRLLFVNHLDVIVIWPELTEKYLVIYVDWATLWLAGHPKQFWDDCSVTTILHRKCWMSFERSAKIREICFSLNSQKVRTSLPQWHTSPHMHKNTP